MWRVLVAWSPESKKPAFFLSTALMFGATSSVYSFNRCSASLWHILVSLGQICCTVFFDDFPCLEPSASSESADHFVIQCLSLLGWRVALQAKKNQPFSSIFSLLGIQVSLEDSDKGFVRVGNKPDRLLELRAELSRLLDQGYIKRSEAAALHGRLNFAQGQFHGCPLKPVMSFLSKVAALGWKDDSMQEFLTAMAYWASCLATDSPRTLKVFDHSEPVRLFTDGAWESDAWGAGAVLVSGRAGTPLVAEVLVPENLVELWKSQGRAQLISQLELFPVLASLVHWGPHIAGRRVLVFVDNNGVRDTLIKGTTPVPENFSMLALIASVTRSYDLTLWITRVPSASNPSDKPSRKRVSEAVSELAGVAAEPLKLPDHLVGALLNSSSFLELMRAGIA